MHKQTCKNLLNFVIYNSKYTESSTELANYGDCSNVVP